MFLHHSVADAQAKPGAFADGLGGIKRVENLVRLLQTGARIGEFDDEVSLFAQRADQQHTAAGRLHRVDRVADQVIENLQNWLGSPRTAGQHAAAFEFDSNILFAQVEIAELNRARENRVQVEQLFFSGDLPRKTEEIGDEVLRPPGLLANFFADGVRPRVCGMLFDQARRSNPESP